MDKYCYKCGATKPATEFCRNASKRDGYSTECKVCSGKASRAWYLANKGRAHTLARKSQLKQLYGITEGAYQSMLRGQGGLCAICQGPETVYDPRMDTLRKLAVDHDHVTGAIRGLLCGRCNQLLGYAKDSHDLLLAAALYTEAACQKR